MADILPLDIGQATDDELRAIHELETDWWASVAPDDPRPPAELTIRRMRHQDPFRDARRWVATEAGEIIGWGELSVGRNRATNNHLADAWVCVAEDRRRRGVGSALLAQLAGAAADEGRRVLDTWAVADSPGASFLDSLGAERRMLERTSRLDVADTDPELLEGWVRQAKERADGYSLVAIDGPVPPELVDDYTRVVHVMNTAPLEELDWEDEVVTPAMTLARNERMLATGGDRWCLVARHDATGAWAGYTELWFNEYTPWIAEQGGTGVFPEHRERGLGRWLKAANLLRLIHERPAVRCVDTGNAGSNAPMLAINDAIGFRPLVWFGAWQQPVADVAAALSGRG